MTRKSLQVLFCVAAAAVFGAYGTAAQAIAYDVGFDPFGNQNDLLINVPLRAFCRSRVSTAAPLMSRGAVSRTAWGGCGTFPPKPESVSQSASTATTISPVSRSLLASFSRLVLTMNATEIL